MFARNKTLITRLTGAVAAASAVGLILAGCGTDTKTEPSPSHPADHSMVETSAPDTSAPGGANAGDPSKMAPPPASVPADRAVPDVPGTKCGATRGPDGALELVILKGKVDCDVAKKVAEEYGPLISTGQKQSVQGWQCGPSDAENILAACAKGEDAFVFQLPN